MTRARNRITQEDCRLTGEVDGFGLVGVIYDDDPRTFFISPSRLEVADESLTEARSDPFLPKEWAA